MFSQEDNATLDTRSQNQRVPSSWMVHNAVLAWPPPGLCPTSTSPTPMCAQGAKLFCSLSEHSLYLHLSLALVEVTWRRGIQTRLGPSTDRIRVTWKANPWPCLGGTFQSWLGPIQNVGSSSSPWAGVPEWIKRRSEPGTALISPLPAWGLNVTSGLMALLPWLSRQYPLCPLKQARLLYAAS